MPIKKSMHKNTKIKNYWVLELSVKWKKLHNCEKKYRSLCKTHKNNKKAIESCCKQFNMAQKEFDKLLNKKKRAYSKGLLLEIEQYNFSNPNAFWECLNKLTFTEVKCACKKSKVKKAVGIDRITNELFKHENSVLLIFNFLKKVLDTGLIPDLWRKVIIHPIPRELGKVTDPLKYRGLALQCCMYKLLSRIVND